MRPVSSAAANRSDPAPCVSRSSDPSITFPLVSEIFTRHRLTLSPNRAEKITPSDVQTAGSASRAGTTLLLDDSPERPFFARRPDTPVWICSSLSSELHHQSNPPVDE